MQTSSISDLLSHPDIEYHDGIYYQTNLSTDLLFEKQYTQLRRIEGRLFEDAVVSKLPDIDTSHPLLREWKIRKHSASRLVMHLRQRQHNTILEVGCGNGWLIHYIHSMLQVDCIGIDINETELKQAARVFGHRQGLAFAYANIYSGLIKKSCADVIILASAIQYFSEAVKVIKELLCLLRPGGQLHILDSPFYTDRTIELAKQQSANYFKKRSCEQMQGHYFHHQWSSLKLFPYSIQYNPNLVFNKLLQRIRYTSPFPWIVIEK
ncbi:MAG: class I SAM-dependent methyltransferase [Bacteroidia bacterium]|nr:class I SAM-dependent methyltransferase [Bacteroidia bacterium]